MTAAFLQAELTSLISDSKRKQSDVRTAAEKSLADLKAIQVTSETQLASDLMRRLQFIDPFILACTSKHVRLAVTGAICLQRLVASRAIPPSRLTDVLDAFQEATQQGLDVQLKVLQSLPSLLQFYALELHGNALAKILSLCASLAGSKTALVNSTATTTFQQLIATVHANLISRETQNEGDDEDLEDAANVFNDMCMVVRGEPPQVLRPQGLTLSIALEVVELSLSNPSFSILGLPSCAASCETFLIPGIIQVLEKSSSFSSFGRGLRIVALLTTTELDRTVDCLSGIFATILNIMDRPSGPPWRRIMCLEYMRMVMSDPQLFRTIYAQFDLKEDKKDVIRALMAILVRIAAEDPALIGLGRQSTIPTNSEAEDIGSGGAAVDVDAVGSVLQAGSNVTGISSRWSTLSSPLLEQLDNHTVPDIPETYVYTLVLACIASFSDGLSKFIMPLSVPNRASIEAVDNSDAEILSPRKSSIVRRPEKYQRLLNPLKREDVSNREEVQTCALLIEDCWPAVLATCSTFLNSALDSYFYHNLVRTVQKLAQVSGVLDLITPRDALLTTLAKVSVPINASSFVTALHGSKLAKAHKDEENGEADEASFKSSEVVTPRISVDVLRQPLNIRNLLCLRALLNLGIALGPTLNETSWFIIVQALQQADALMSVSPAVRHAANKQKSQEEPEVEGQPSLGSEVNAVGTASKRMLESTKTYSDEMLEVFLNSIFKLIETLNPIQSPQGAGEDNSDMQKPNSTPRKHKATRSVSGVSTTATVLYIEAEFVLKTINDLARINLHRFCSSTSQLVTWNFLIARLLSLVEDSSISSQLRVQAATIIDSVSMEVARMLEKQEQSAKQLEELQNLCLSTLSKQLAILYARANMQTALATDVEIHRRLLEALENIVSHSGDSLTSGWRIVFDILQRTTRQSSAQSKRMVDNLRGDDQELVLERTLPPAFRTVQLIVADFLNTIDPLSFSILVELLPLFGAQRHDLNISLTTTVLFSNLSALLLERTEIIDSAAKSNEPEMVSNGHAGVVAGKATDVSSLWFAVVFQLCQLCKDERGDARNSALRVLIRIFESSSSQLSTKAWNISFVEALLPVLKEYSNKEKDPSPWHSSYAQLLQGIVSLFAQNAQSITDSADFTATWEALIDVINGKLKEQTLEGHTVIFTSATELLRALGSTKVPQQTSALPLLRCWYENHPAKIAMSDTSNQESFSAYAQLLTAICETAIDTVRDFLVEDRSSVFLAMTAVKQSVLASVHPPYTSDVTKLAPEQVAIVENLMIIQKMMLSGKGGYTEFLLDLIENALLRNTATEVEQQKIEPGLKGLKRPTLIAFMTECIRILRHIFQDEAAKPDFLSSASIKHTLPILTSVVNTKYMNVPTSSDSPAWQSASGAIVDFVEILQNHIDIIPVQDLDSLSQAMPRALEAILNAPSLETKQPPPSSDIITKDETFDIEHFTRFHKATLPLLQLFDFPNEHRKQYIITLFNASLIAKPWFGDLPADLPNSPLAQFENVRPGSIRPPDFLPRKGIPFQALEALFNTVNRISMSSTDPDTDVTAKAAAPYVLLRIAHSIKVFLADQRLRNLIPPPRPLQHELNVILNKALHLRVIDEAFCALAPDRDRDRDQDQDQNRSIVGVKVGIGSGDGKTHLRILYPLILRLRDFWFKLPRLKVCAWQDGDDGRAVEGALDRWGQVLAEGWNANISVAGKEP